MKDRFGNRIDVGWAVHEEIWVEAALTLPKNMRTAAYQDIADMTGRSLGCVRFKAGNLASEQRLEAALRAFVPSTIMVVAPGANRGWDKRKAAA